VGLECVEVGRRLQRHDASALAEQASRSPLTIVVDQFARAVRFDRQATTIPVRDGVHEGFARVRDVRPLEAPYRSAELTVAKDVFYPSMKVAAVEVALHNIRWQIRKRGDQVANGPGPRPYRTSRLREHEFLVETYGNVGVLPAMTDVSSQSWGNSESLQRST
jgi:hypothetical protein